VRELGKISSGVLGHLDETRLLLARLALYFSRFTPPGPRNTNHCGTRPTLLNSIFISLLIYRIRLYLVLTLHHLSYCVFIACANVHARFIQLLNCMIVDPPLIFTFLLCIQLVYTH